MVYKFFYLLLPFFKDRTGKPAEPFYFSQDHLSRAAKSCAGVFFYRAEPANPRRKAYLNPIKQAERLAQYRVKGHCPLRVQGGARRSLPQAIPPKAKPEPHETSLQTCAHCRKAIPADRRNPNSKSKSSNLRPLPQGNPRRQAHLNPKASRQTCTHCRKAIPADRRTQTPKASRQTCTHCRRQSPPTGAPRPP